MSDWIPVSEKLPEEDNQEYIVYVPNRNYVYSLPYYASDPDPAFDTFEYDGPGFYEPVGMNRDGGDYMVRVNVTHWMPFPEPPKHD